MKNPKVYKIILEMFEIHILNYNATQYMVPTCCITFIHTSYVQRGILGLKSQKLMSKWRIILWRNALEGRHDLIRFDKIQAPNSNNSKWNHIDFVKTKWSKNIVKHSSQQNCPGNVNKN